MSNRVRPFRLLGQSTKVALLSALTPVIAAWHAEWFTRKNSGVTASELDDEMQSKDERWMVFSGDPTHWVAWRLGDQLALLRFLLNDNVGAGDSELCETLYRECIRDLMVRLSAVTDFCLQSPPSFQTTQELDTFPGSGIAIVSFSGDLASQKLMLSGDFCTCICVKAHFPNESDDAGLVAGEKALQEHLTKIKVTLGEVELTLGELAELAIGDVITLDMAANDELPICLEDGNPILKAQLGRNGQYKSVVITSR